MKLLHLDEFPGLSLSHHLYHLSLLASLPYYILFFYRAVVGSFLLVGQHWLVHVKGSISDRH